MSIEDGFVEISGKKYQIVTLDFETFFDKTYTLSGKINTSEYIRDDRFHAHGVGIKVGNGKTLWYTGKNIPLALREIDWSKSAMLAHNTAFDGFICSHVYGIRPAVYLDTLSMARAAHGHHMRHDLDTIAKAHGLAGKVKRDALADTKGKQQLTDKEERALGAYCVDDVEDTYKIFWKLFDYIPDDELRLIDMTQRMFCDPILRIDIPRVQAELEKEIGSKAAALLRSGASVEDLMSNEKFARLLQAAGAQLPQKISPSTGKLTYAFAKSDLAFQDLMKNGNDKIRALCEARLKVKSTIGETRAARFLEAGKNGMCLPILLNYSGAHTHRWCMAGDAEVLTPHGWKRFDTCNATETVAQWSPEGRTVSFVEAPIHSFPNTDKLHTISSDYIKASYTPDHVIPRFTTHDVFKAEPVQTTCLKNARIPISGTLETGVSELSEPQIQLMVASQADGCLDKANGRWRFGFRKARKVARLEALLGEVGIKYHKFVSGKEVCIDVPRGEVPDYFTKEFELARLLSWDVASRNVFLNELAFWDGSHTSKYVHYSTTSRGSADAVATIAHITGHGAVVVTTRRNDKNPLWKDKYTVSVRFNKSFVHTNPARWGETLVAPSHVYCPTTETGFFVVRQNGRIHITGNSGGNRLNLQNLKRGGELRRSILAPKGHVIVVADSAQIEARVLAWLAGQTDIVNAFANKEDVYKLMASAIYGVPVDQVTKDQRFIGKICVLGLGYGMGHMKLQQTLKQGVMGPPVDISIEECRRIVNIYRSRNYKIRQLWKTMDGIIASMLTGTHGEYGPLTYGKGYIQLPSGLFLQYYGLHGEAEVRRDDLVVYEATYLTRQGRSKIYAGLLTENCLAENTQVLTDVGWVAIENITPNMLVHDGVEFVQHGGVLTKSVQNCVNIDGVYMTPDHEVLTNDGWQAASQNPEPYRPDIRLPDSIVCSARSEGKTPMDVSLRVWGAKECGGYGIEKRGNQKLRVPDQGHAVKSTNYTRHVEAPRIRSMAIDDRPLQTTYTPRLEELRRARDYCLQTMATVRDLLGGYGGLLPARVNTGPGRQQLRLLQTELPLGVGPGTGHEPAQHRPCRQYTGTQRENRDITVNSVPPHSSRVVDGAVDARAKPAKPVFDILNCGPRQRFVVLGNNGPFIVHNCVQALARCIIADQMLEISKKYRICTMSHDEIIVVAPKKDAKKCLADMIHIMSTPPDWADGLPLAAEGGWSVNYSK